MEKLKEALKQLPHIQTVWVDKTDRDRFYYRKKNGFEEMSRGAVLAEDADTLEDQAKKKNKK